MAFILIIGMGNCLRCDDGVGWHIAHQLRGQFSTSDVNVIAIQQLLPEIAEQVSLAEKVLFVDALHGGNPGSIRIQPILPAADSPLDSHHLTPASVLRLALELYKRCPQAFLLTIAGESFTAGESFSKPVREALSAAQDAIERFLSWARQGGSSEAAFPEAD